MNLFPLILARGSDDNFGKVIGGIVFVAIWIIGAIISQAKKKSQTPGQKPQRSWEEIVGDMIGGRQPPPQPPIQPPLPKATARPAAHRQKSARRQRRNVVAPPLPTVPAPQHSIASLASPPLVEATIPSPHAADAYLAPHVAPPRAKTISKLLTRPGLRLQFLLSEILQPPVAMRQDRQI